MRTYLATLFCFVVCSALSVSLLLASAWGQESNGNSVKSTIRFASFNISFNRKSEGQLKKSLSSGKGKNFSRIAEIIQRVDPDVILLNEFDYDPDGEGLASFESKFLAVDEIMANRRSSLRTVISLQ